jgi:CheY-like chemotaxis protein
MHALTIEDEPHIAMLIEDCLRERGYMSVSIAGTEAEAVAAGLSCCPDLITSDVRLTEGCGIAAVERICLEKLIPTVFVTGTAQDALERVPTAALLTKPFTVCSLERALEQVLSDSKRIHIAAIDAPTRGDIPHQPPEAEKSVRA